MVAVTVETVQDADAAGVVNDTIVRGDRRTRGGVYRAVYCIGCITVSLYLLYLLYLLYTETGRAGQCVEDVSARYSSFLLYHALYRPCAVYTQHDARLRPDTRRLIRYQVTGP